MLGVWRTSIVVGGNVTMHDRDIATAEFIHPKLLEHTCYRQDELADVLHNISVYSTQKPRRLSYCLYRPYKSSIGILASTFAIHDSDCTIIMTSFTECEQ